MNYEYVHVSTKNDVFSDLNKIFGIDVYICFTSKDVGYGGFSIAEARYKHNIICDIYSTDFTGKKTQTHFGATYYDRLKLEENSDGYIKVTKENEEMVIHLINQYLSVYDVSLYHEGEINKELYNSFLFKKIIAVSK